MKRVMTVGCAALALAVSGCGGTPTPVRPSPPTSIPLAGSASAIPVVTSWRCLAQSAAGTRGIFSGGFDDVVCPARTQVAVVDGAVAEPGAPSNLTSSVTGSTVRLTWQAPISPDSATSYLITAASDPGFFILVAAFDTRNTATTFTATDVPSGTYYVRVYARNSAGTSAEAAAAVFDVGGGSCVAGPPAAPANLTSSVSGSSVALSWALPPSGCAPDGYMIEAGSTTASSNLANFNTGSTATSFSTAGVGAGTYYVRVRAAHGSSVSGPSNEVVVVVGGSATNVSGRWIGNAPDGVIFSVPAAPDTFCDDADDLQLDLTQVGTALSGTVTLRTRSARTPPACRAGDTTAGSAMLSNGTADGAGVSFRLGSGPMSFTFSGVVSGNRMSGVVICGGDQSQCGTFAATKQ